jgi:quinol monooxygenase YgiN
MAGVVHVPWYATVFRGDKLEAALKEIAPIALRYGASSYAVHRNRDDPYKLLQMATFESKSDWERYWNGPDMIRFRAVNQSLYQVPLLYSWADVIVEGYLDEEPPIRTDLTEDRSVTGTAEMN